MKTKALGVDLFEYENLASGFYFRLRVEFKLEDFWIGAFWKRELRTFDMSGLLRLTTDVWICLVPCVPLRFSFAKQKRRAIA